MAVVLCVSCDAQKVLTVVTTAVEGARRQVHRGVLCRHELCDTCLGLVHEGYVAVLSKRDSGACLKLSEGQIATAARNTFVDDVRRRLGAAGIRQKPEDWVRSPRSLVGVPPMGRVVVGLCVKAVAFYSVLPASAVRFELDVECVGRLVEGVRVGGKGLAKLRTLWTFDDTADLNQVVEVGRSALEVWKGERPQEYVGLLALNAENAGWVPLDHRPAA